MDEVARAIADPVRRQILVMLHGHRLSAGQIAGRFTISRPAVSRHLRVLRESGLVHDDLVGRRRLYTLDADAFTEISAWLAQFAPPSTWDRRLDPLEPQVHRPRREHRRRHAADHRKESRA